MIDSELRGIETAGYNWLLARGRVRSGEPLYAVQIFTADDECRATDLKPVFEVEDDNLHACLIRCRAFVEEQAR